MSQDWRARRDEAIQQYCEAGLRPIPLRPKTKIPYQRGFQKFKPAPFDEVIKEFRPQDNVGLVCGIEQDGGELVVVDYDNLDQHEAALDDGNYARFDWLLDSPCVKTGGGNSVHHYIVCEDSKQ